MLQVSLLTDNGSTKDDLRLPTDESMLSQVSDLVFLSERIQQVFFFPISFRYFFEIWTFIFSSSFICLNIWMYLSVFAGIMLNDLSDVYDLVMEC